MPDIRTVKVTRYALPLREGGSLPALTEADDGFMYVLKFRGAGQGPKALIAELLGGELARAAGLRVPELVFAELDAAFGRTEADEEIQDLLRASEGLNLGMHYLSGSITYDPAVTLVDATLASRIVWLDAFLTNVDRTARNTNMLMWHHDLWLIDHGAALYFHHNWDTWAEQATKPFALIRQHVLLSRANALKEAHAYMSTRLTEAVIRSVVALIPDAWLDGDDPVAMRAVYADFLVARLRHADIFLNEALHAVESI